MKAICRFWASLAERPRPLSPMWMIFLPMASNSGCIRAMVASLPPTMKINVPPSAAIFDPVTGASKKSQPRSGILAANWTLAEGEIVLESATTAPLSSACTAPFEPKSTCSTALVSETHIQTASLPLTASAGLAAVAAPGTSLPALRFQTVTSCPALTRFAAIGRPIIPNPRKAIRIPWIKNSVGDCVKGYCQKCHECHNCQNLPQNPGNYGNPGLHCYFLCATIFSSHLNYRQGLCDCRSIDTSYPCAPATGGVY